MRDELVVWLKSGDVATSATTAIKALRLSQITGGFLGGVEAAGILTPDDARDQLWGDEDVTRIGLEETNEHMDAADVVRNELFSGGNHGGAVRHSGGVAIQEIGREKLDILLWFIGQRLDADPNLHLVAWCRFRSELFRMVNVVHSQFPQFECGMICGEQKRADRLAALALLKPETSPEGPVFVGGIEGTGSFGLDFTASHWVKALTEE